MVTTLKDLEKLLKLCRKQGVTEIELDTVKFKLGELPFVESNQTNVLGETKPKDNYEDFPDGKLTEEQLMYYSSGGLPENDPENQSN
jgi:hypothetical protein